MKRSLRSERGVTMIELMITTVIIGLVAAMAVPRFQIAYDRLQFKSGNRDLTSTLKLARSLAITDKDQYGVYFDAENLSIVLFKDATSGAYAYSSGIDSVIRADTLPYQFSYMTTDLEGHVVFFRPNGSADFNGGGNIYTLADTQDLLGIYGNNILASTGRIQTISYYY